MQKSQSSIASIASFTFSAVNGISSQELILTSYSVSSFSLMPMISLSASNSYKTWQAGS